MILLILVFILGSVVLNLVAVGLAIHWIIQWLRALAERAQRGDEAFRYLQQSLVQKPPAPPPARPIPFQKPE